MAHPEFRSNQGLSGQRDFQDYSRWATGLKKHKRPLTASQWHIGACIKPARA
ncbi:Hypothetical protein FKW44_010856 [Caligus rogercresseyi]|uniref:Uncharacterized protein n=1 Tax=Caligus rogercresseyi TaxID=217165 RepID=A0A7T8K7P6_CALRO|nr:Hypothetical protein FKW44_010856 [Caligus rogercresseyi]